VGNTDKKFFVRIYKQNLDHVRQIILNKN